MESVEYDDAFVDRFNGIRCCTASLLIVVSGTYAQGRDVIVLWDAAANPKLDLKGGIVFGAIGRATEVFCIVGNMFRRSKSNV